MVGTVNSESNTGTSEDFLRPTSGTLKIGTNSVQFFEGSIDDIRIYNQALTASEIQSIYQENGWDIKNIKAFSLPSQITDATIDVVTHEIDIEVSY